MPDIMKTKPNGPFHANDICDKDSHSRRRHQIYTPLAPHLHNTKPPSRILKTDVDAIDHLSLDAWVYGQMLDVDFEIGNEEDLDCRTDKGVVEHLGEPLLRPRACNVQYAIFIATRSAAPRRAAAPRRTTFKTPCHTTPRRAAPHRATLRRTMLNHAAPRHVLDRQAVPHRSSGMHNRNECFT